MSIGLYIEENSHYGESAGRRPVAEYANWEAAVAVARQRVEEDLRHLYKKGMSADELYMSWSMFGQDVYLVPDETQAFSARDHARNLAATISSP